MKVFCKSEAAAALLWVGAALLLAAALTPWLYQAGMWFASIAAVQEFPKLFEALGRACSRAELPRYFSRSLLISALALLPFLVWRLRRLHSGDAPKLLNLRRANGREVVAQVLTGCLIAGGILWGLMLILTGSGVFVQTGDPLSFGKFFGKILVPTVAAPLVEELIFRGLLLGLWLRSARPLTACVGTSLVFAFLHFLAPPDDFAIPDRQAVTAGFQLLGVIVLHFTDFKFFVTDFATLFVVGLILAWSRVRTGGLWFAIGLHAGWVFAFKCASVFYESEPGHFLQPWGIGENVRSGLLPMLSLGLTAIACHFAMKRFETMRRAPI